MKSTSWKNVHAELCIEVARVLDDDDNPVSPEAWMDMSHETPLPECLGIELARLYPVEYAKPQAWFEIVIEISCSGSYTPAQLYGPPEKCYPAEGDDEREVVSVTVYPEMERGYNKNGKDTRQAVTDALEGVYREKIIDMEIYVEPDYPEYE